MFDMQYLEENFGQDPELLKELFEAYSMAGEDALSDFESAIKQESCAAFAAACHKLKSSARTVGDCPLSDLCDELEKLAVEDDLFHLQGSYSLLKERIRISIAAARNKAL